ncbi:transposase [Maribacter litoralis]|uniref:transposase n=1 Tax=Maribacter litoralis TaxID=2059726 RepID=UPI003F5CE13E
MDTQWCKGTLKEAIAIHGKPKIFNTDQGSQFTSEVFTCLVRIYDIKLSMDGNARAIDNVSIERSWRSVKYESVYLNPPDTGIDLYQRLKTYFDFYNNRRRRKGIDNQIPFKRYLIKPQINSIVINN